MVRRPEGNHESVHSTTPTVSPVVGALADPLVAPHSTALRRIREKSVPGKLSLSPGDLPLLI